MPRPRLLHPHRLRLTSLGLGLQGRGGLTVVFAWSLAAWGLAGCQARPETVNAPDAAPGSVHPSKASAGLTLGERVGDHAFAVPIATARVALVGAAGEDPAADLSIDSATCGACHADILAEWRQSTHAAALGDPQFLAELSKPGAPAWLCLSCHTPLAAQRTDLLAKSTLLSGADATRLGLPVPAPNPDFDPALAKEGVTCATCHVRVDADGRGTVIGPRGDTQAPHRVRPDRAALRGICARCHDPGPLTLTPQFTCWFETEREVAAGPLAGSACTTCHMPAVNRALALGGPIRATPRHLWVGGGPPKSLAGLDSLLARGFAPGFDLKVAQVPLRTTPHSDLAPTPPHRVQVTLHNRRAGHQVTTGDPERFLRIWAEVIDDRGDVLARQHRDLGQTWDFGDAATGRPARKLADNRLKPDESRALGFELPQGLNQQWLRVQVLHIRMTPENAEYAAGTPTTPEVERLWPGAAEAVASLATEAYPKAMVVAEWRALIATGEATSAPPAALIEASRALNALPKAALQKRIGHLAPPANP